MPKNKEKQEVKAFSETLPAAIGAVARAMNDGGVSKFRSPVFMDETGRVASWLSVWKQPPYTGNQWTVTRHERLVICDKGSPGPETDNSLIQPQRHLQTDLSFIDALYYCAAFAHEKDTLGREDVAPSLTFPHAAWIDYKEAAQIAKVPLARETFLPGVAANGVIMTEGDFDDAAYALIGGQAPQEDTPDVAQPGTALALIGDSAAAVVGFDEALEAQKEKLLEELRQEARDVLDPIEKERAALKAEKEKALAPFLRQEALLQKKYDAISAPFDKKGSNVLALSDMEEPLQGVGTALQLVQEKKFGAFSRNGLFPKILFPTIFSAMGIGSSITFFSIFAAAGAGVIGPVVLSGLLLAITGSCAVKSYKDFSKWDVTSQRHYKETLEALERRVSNLKDKDQILLFERFNKVARAVYHLEHAAYLNTKGPLSRRKGQKVLEAALKDIDPEIISPGGAESLRAAYNNKSFPAPGSFAAVLEAEINNLRNAANAEAVRILQDKPGKQSQPALPAP